MWWRIRIISAPLMAITECNAGARTGTPTFLFARAGKEQSKYHFPCSSGGNILYERPDRTVFSSKLVATIRPEMPVYDKHVRANLLLALPGNYMAPDVRVREFITVYCSLELRVAAIVRNSLFVQDLRPLFDTRFPTYSHFTDVKKLDLFLWQHRTANGVV